MPDVDPLTEFTRPSNPSVDALISKHADRTGLDPELVQRVIGQESRGHNRAVSPKGAGGLMQIMPGTAAQLGVKNVFDPDENIRGGTDYLKQQLDKFGDVNLALAAYNAGPGAVIKHGNKIPPYAETQNYVRKIAGGYQGTGYAQDPLTTFTQGKSQPVQPSDPLSNFTQPETSVAPQGRGAAMAGTVSSGMQGETPMLTSNDAAWHFGMTPDEAKGLSRRARNVLTEAVAEDQRKKADGETIAPPPLKYQNDMRKRAGLQPLKFNIATDQNKPSPYYAPNATPFSIGEKPQIQVNPRPFTFNPPSDDQIKAGIQSQVAGEAAQAESARPSRLQGGGVAPPSVDVQAETEKRFSDFKAERAASLDYARHGPSMQARTPGFGERASVALNELLQKYAPGIASIDTPGGLKTDVLRGAISSLNVIPGPQAAILNRVSQPREITPEEKLLNPNAEADASGMLSPYNIGRGVSTLVPFVGAGKLVSAAGVVSPALKTALTFGIMDAGRQLAQTGKIDPAQLAETLLTGGAMGKLEGVDPGLLRRIAAYIAPQLSVDIAKQTPHDQILQNATQNALFALAGGHEAKEEAFTQTVPDALQAKLRGGEIDSALAAREAAVKPVTDAQGNVLLNADEIARDSTAKPKIKLANQGERANETQTQPNIPSQPESAQPAEQNLSGQRSVAQTPLDQPRSMAERVGDAGQSAASRPAGENALGGRSETVPNVRHVDLQSRVKRGDGKGQFKEETKAQTEVRRAQVAPQTAEATPEQPNTVVPAKEPWERTRVVNAESKPLLMRHGSIEDFEKFDKSKIRAEDYDAPFNGFWFTSDEFASPAFRDPKFTKEAYVDIRNPAPASEWKGARREAETNFDRYKERGARGFGDATRMVLQDKGYDGVIWSAPPKVNLEEYARTGSTKFKDVRGVQWELRKDPDGGTDLYDRHGEHITGYESPESYLSQQTTEAVAFEPDQIHIQKPVPQTPVEAAPQPVETKSNEPETAPELRPPVEGERSFPKTLEATGRQGGTDRTYQVVRDQDAIDKADARIKNDPEAARQWASDQLDKGSGKEAIATGLKVADNLSSDAAKESDSAKAADKHAQASDLYSKLAARLTESGQEVQAASLARKYSPSGAALEVQRIVEKVKGEKAKPELRDVTTARDLAEQYQTADARISELEKKITQLQSGKPIRAPRESSLTPLKAKLDKAAQDAQLRISATKAKMEAGELEFRNAGPLPGHIATHLTDYAIIGAAKIAKGGLTFAEWSAEMVKDLGEDVKPHLATIFRASKKHLDEQRATAKEESAQRGATKELTKRSVVPTPENIESLRQEKSKLQAERRQARSDLDRHYRDLERKEQGHKLDAVLSLTRDSLLSARGVLRIAMGMGGKQVMDFGSRFVKAGTDVARSTVTGGPRTVSAPSFASTFRTVGGFVERAPSAIRNAVQGKPSEVMPNAHGGPTENPYVNLTVGIMQRIYAGKEAFLSSWAYPEALENNARVFALNDRADGITRLGQTNQRTRDYLAGKLSFEGQRNQKLAESLAKQAADYEVKSKQIIPSMEAVRAKEMADSPTELLKSMALQATDRAVYRQPFESKLAQKIGQIGTDSTGGKIARNIVLPFSKRPANNIADNLFGYTGLRIFGEGYKGIRESINGEFGPARVKSFNDAIGKGATGAAVMAVGAALAKSGKLISPLDKDKSKAGSLFINGKYYNISNVPVIGWLLGMGAAYQTDGAANLPKALYRMISEHPLLKTAKDVSDMVEGLKSNKLGEQISEYVGRQASRLIPAPVKIAGEALDTEERQTKFTGKKADVKENLIAPTKASLPILRRTLPSTGTKGRLSVINPLYSKPISRRPQGRVIQ